MTDLDNQCHSKDKWLPTFWTPSGLRAKQQEVADRAKAFDRSVKSCPSLSSQQVANWNDFYTRLTLFTGTSFGWLTTVTPNGGTEAGGGTGETADQLEEYERNLCSWGQRLEGWNCALNVPNLDPNPPSNNTLVNALRYGAVIAGFLGTAYAVGKVVEFLPKPAKRA
jgi:hypothetical protein